MANPKEYYGKRIAYRDIEKVFPNNTIVYKDRHPDIPNFVIQNCTIVPVYIGNSEESTADLVGSLARSGIKCGTVVTGEENILCLF